MEFVTLGLSVALMPENLFACLMGVFIGTAIGVIPGLGPLAAISLLMPLTFAMEPTTGIVMLAGVYYGAEYGGSTASILLNLPGTPASAITCLDGHPLAKQGKAGLALVITTLASFVGGSLGIIMLMALTPFIVQVGLAFGPAEYFALIVLCFISVATIGGSNPFKGLAMMALGALLGTVGTDIYDGVDRFTFGNNHLIDGIGLVPVAMGLFGLSEVIASVRDGSHRVRHKVTLAQMIPPWAEVKRCIWPTLRGSASGCIFGALPATGPSIASIVAYSAEKRVAREPERFGQGAVEGVASPEAANNAAVQAAFIPTLTLGIPGTPTMAVIIGALMIHGVVPGPMLIQNDPGLYYGLVASFWIGNLLLLILNIPLIGIWVSLLNVPYRLLYPAIIALICIGCYSVHNSTFDVIVMLGLGVLGYLLRRLGFSPAPFLIGFVLSPMLEENFRRAMILGRGRFSYLVSSPVAAGALALAALTLVWMFADPFLRRRAARRRAGA